MQKQAHLAGSGRETDGALLIFWRNRRTERLCSPPRYRRNESPTRADGTTRMGKTERERERCRVHVHDNKATGMKTGGI